MMVQKFLQFAALIMVGAIGYIYLQWNSAADNDLLEAAGVGDLPRAAEALRAGANVNASDFDAGTTPLIFAASRNNLPMAILLVKAGAKLDSEDAGGSALFYACAHHRDDVGKFLQGVGAHVRASPAALDDLRQDKTAAEYCR